MVDSGEIIVAIPLFERFTTLDVVGPYEVLHWVPNIVVKFVADEANKLVRADSGELVMKTNASYDDVPCPHVILIPGGPGYVDAIADQRLIQWIKQAHETSMYTTSVCIGALILASTGILTGLTATTHWDYYDILKQYGAIPVDKRVIQRGKIITSAGVSSGIDMALELLRILKDNTMSKVMQLFVEYDPQPPFDVGTASKAAGEVLEITKKLIPELTARNDAIYKQSLETSHTT